MVVMRAMTWAIDRRLSPVLGMSLVQSFRLPPRHLVQGLGVRVLMLFVVVFCHQ
jgi:hypothetical protein